MKPMGAIKKIINKQINKTENSHFKNHSNIQGTVMQGIN